MLSQKMLTSCLTACSALQRFLMNTASVGCFASYPLWVHTLIFTKLQEDMWDSQVLTQTLKQDILSGARILAANEVPKLRRQTFEQVRTFYSDKVGTLRLRTETIRRPSRQFVSTVPIA